jgi:hypothetical protein
MIELDYAYLADYAQVSNGKISSIGASFTHVKSIQIPSLLAFSIAGRVRVSEDIQSVAMSLVVSSKASDLRLNFEGTLIQQDSRPYQGKVGLLFSFTTQIPLMAKGLYEVQIFLEGKEVRRLAFDVEG